MKSAVTPAAHSNSATAPDAVAAYERYGGLSAALRGTRNVAMALALLARGTGTAAAQELDDEAALNMAKKSHCLKCHSIERRKNAPSYKNIAAKYKGVASAEQTLYKHLTESQTVKADDGDEAHPTLQTKNDREILNVVRWVLSR